MNKETIDKAIKILYQALKREGAYSRDRLEHADNTIQSMCKLIGEAIEVLSVQETAKVHEEGSIKPMTQKEHKEYHQNKLP